MSKLFVDEIVHQSSQGSGTITIGASGETINVVGTLQNNGSAVGKTNTPAFLAYITGSDFSVSNATWTTIGFNNAIVNNGSGFDTGTYKFTVPSGQNGLYSFSAGFQMEGMASGNTIEFSIMVNQAGSYQSTISDIISASQTFKRTTTRIVNLSVADYVEVRIYQNSGGTRGVSANSAYFGGYKITT